MIRTFVFVVAAGLASMVAGGPQVDDFKCQACDVAVMTWAKNAIRTKLECARRVQGAARDAQLDSLLPPLNATLFDQGIDCDFNGALTIAAAEGVVPELCRSLFLEHFPYVEEFPVDDTNRDNDKQWDSPPGYFSRTAAQENIKPMQPSHVTLLRAACDLTLDMKSAKRVTRVVSTVRSAVNALDVGRLEDLILASHGDTLAAFLSAAEADVRDGLDATDFDEDDDAENSATDLAIAAAQSAARQQFMLAQKRQAIYDVVLKLQTELCGSAACDSTIQRPKQERRVRGWSATLKRM
jgi:hypothetical protein